MLPTSPWFGYLRGLTAESRRTVAGLIRLAVAVGRGPREEHASAAEALWRTIRSRDDSMAGADAIMWAKRLFRETYCPDPPPAPPPQQEPDPRPGYYYVSALDRVQSRADGSCNGRYLVAGPYTTHAEALGLVDAVRAHAEQIDARACWMAWGTARTEDPHQTPLEVWHCPQDTLRADRACGPDGGDVDEDGHGGSPDRQVRKRRQKRVREVAAYVHR